MKIPIFVSCPTSLNATQEQSRSALMRFLDEFNLEPRALGRSDYPAEFPLREVLVIAKHCAGGIVLGFEQFHFTAGTVKRGLGKRKGGKTQKRRINRSTNRMEKPGSGNFIWSELTSADLQGAKNFRWRFRPRSDRYLHSYNAKGQNKYVSA
jgi:hypothetical protein